MNVLTPDEAATFLHMSRRQLDRLKREHLMEGLYYRVGKRILYIESKLQAWAEAGGTLQYES